MSVLYIHKDMFKMGILFRVFQTCLIFNILNFIALLVIDALKAYCGIKATI